jgi:hypothetical protein
MIYVIGDYEEHGLEHVKATTDASKVEAILEELLATYGFLKADVFKNDPKHNGTHEREALKAALEEDTTGRFDLSLGWGGVVLYILEDY